MNAVEIILLIVFLGGAVAFIIYNLIKWNKQQEAKEEGLIKYSAIYTGILKHVEGLPIAGGSFIEFFYGKKKLTFKKDNQEISLDRDKIISIDLVSGQDMKNQAATGAIAGKYLLGGLGGAALGVLLMATFYLVIIYEKDGENKTILLDSTGSSFPFKKMLDDFKSDHQKEIKIDL
jgi:hypothetical protein